MAGSHLSLPVLLTDISHRAWLSYFHPESPTSSHPGENSLEVLCIARLTCYPHHLLAGTHPPQAPPSLSQSCFCPSSATPVPAHRLPHSSGSHVPPLLFTAVINIMTQSNLCREVFIWLRVHQFGKPRQELEAGTGAETGEECCLLACLSWLSQSTSL